VDRDVVTPFGETVYHYHNSIKAFGSEKGANKVNRDMLPTLRREREGLQGTLVLQPK
jgi:hypothetical protein